MEAKKCSHHRCELEVYEDSDKCVLHCKKDNKYKHDKWDLYKRFEDELINEIAHQLKEYGNDKVKTVVKFTKEVAIDLIYSQGLGKYFLEKSNTKNKEDTIVKLIIFDNIIFPQGKSQDSFFYNKILKKLEAIHFNYCEFNVSYLELDNIKCFFQDCVFHISWILPNCSILENEDNVVYQACIFHGDVVNYTSDNSQKLAIYQSSQFDYTCQFKKSIKFNSSKFTKMLFNTNQGNYSENHTIDKIIIEDCIFEKRFKLKNHRIKKFFSKNSLFKSKFEFRENSLESFKVFNTNFEGIFDCNLNYFLYFHMEKSVFSKYVGFEECIFGNNVPHESEVAVFKYVSFLDYSYFRRATFNSGLDLETTNLEEYPNFLYINVEPSYTNKETFRIIKHSFDKVGNTTEANKFFAYEMEKEGKNIKYSEDLNKKIMLNLNHWVSNFGQSWLKPLVWIFIFAIIHSLLNYAIDNNTFKLVDSKSSIYDFLQFISNSANQIAKNILPFKKALEEGKEFISLLFLIINSVLIYNLIVAVKRITKR